jgi:hypothetical protein
VGPDDRTDAEQVASDAVRVAQFTMVLKDMTSKATDEMQQASGVQQERITRTGSAAVEECRKRNLAAEGKCNAITERLLASHDLALHDVSKVWVLQTTQRALLTQLHDAHAEQDKVAGAHTEALRETAASVRSQLAENLKHSFDKSRQGQDDHLAQATRCINDIITQRRHQERHMGQCQDTAVNAVEARIQEGLTQLDERRAAALASIEEATRESRTRRRARRKEQRRGASRSPSRRRSQKRQRSSQGECELHDGGSCSR